MYTNMMHSKSRSFSIMTSLFVMYNAWGIEGLNWWWRKKCLGIEEGRSLESDEYSGKGDYTYLIL